LNRAHADQSLQCAPAVAGKRPRHARSRRRRCLWLGRGMAHRPAPRRSHPRPPLRAQPGARVGRRREGRAPTLSRLCGSGNADLVRILHAGLVVVGEGLLPFHAPTQKKTLTQPLPRRRERGRKAAFSPSPHLSHEGGRGEGRPRSPPRPHLSHEGGSGEGGPRSPPRPHPLPPLRERGRSLSYTPPPCHAGQAL